MHANASFLQLAIVALGALAGTSVADGCKNKPIGGLPFCNPVDEITYRHIGSTGKYDRVIGMDSKTCKCDTRPTEYSGALAPLDEEISIHFRGPLILKQFAVYYPSSSPQAQKSKHAKTLLKPGSYTRTAWYSAEKQIAQGLVVQNHMGDEKVSGTWDECWGNSLSYADSHCMKPAAKPQVLADAPMKSNQEFVIFSDEKCGSNCGFYRPKTPAHHGFDGSDKMFAFEFGMPYEPHATGANPNLPSIWGLNAQIPRTSQYSSCSSWRSGGGEIDMFEVIKGATPFVKTHFHGNQGSNSNDARGGGGSMDYFDRPHDKVIKANVVFTKDGTVTIRILSTSFEFSTSIDSNLIAAGGKDPSVFDVPS